MMKLIHFEAEHGMSLLRNKNKFGATEEDLIRLSKCQHAYTLLDGEGEVLVIGGIVEYWAGRGEAWAIISDKARKNFLPVHRFVKGVLGAIPMRRIEAAVEHGTGASSRRWLLALGFERETQLARKFLPNGADCSLYVRVR